MISIFPSHNYNPFLEAVHICEVTDNFAGLTSGVKG